MSDNIAPGLLDLIKTVLEGRGMYGELSLVPDDPEWDEKTRKSFENRFRFQYTTPAQYPPFMITTVPDRALRGLPSPIIIAKYIVDMIQADRNLQIRRHDHQEN